MFRRISMRFVCLLFALIVLSFAGCRLVGPGGDEGQPVPSVVSGVVYEPAAAGNQKLSSSMHAAAALRPLAGALVWIEEFPQYSTTSDENGSYAILIPFFNSNMRVVAKKSNGNTIWKNRSNPLVFSGLNAESIITLEVATSTAVGQILPGELPIQFPATLSLWGESFTTDENGFFTTPPLPSAFNFGQIIFAGQGGIPGFRFQAPFIQSIFPAWIAVLVPSQEGSQNSIPSALLSATLNGQEVFEVTGGQQIKLTATAQDDDIADADRLSLSWNITKGALADGPDQLSRFWTAPAESGVATISVMVTDPQNAMATCSIRIQVNSAPQPPDTTSPTVLAVNTDKADGKYSTGTEIDITVQFNEIVRVTGLPRLKLETGADDRYAVYQSGDNSNTLTFKYQVQAGDASTDLDYASTSALELNGGTIKDAEGNDAVLTLPAISAAGSLSNNRSIEIDAVAPSVAAVNSDAANGKYYPASVIDIKILFSETVKVTGSPRLKLETGVNDRYASYISGDNSNTLVFRYESQNGDSSTDLDYTGTDSLELNGGTINDSTGNVALITLPEPASAGSLGNNKAIEVDTPPVAVVTGGAPANPSNTAAFSITVGGSGVAAYRYNLDGENGGAFSNEIPAGTPISGTLADGSHVLKIIGRNARNFWQAEADATVISWNIAVSGYSFVRIIGGEWSTTTEGQVSGGSGVTVDTNGNIYVVDQENCRVQKFNSSGQFLKTWASFGVGDENLKYPIGIVVDNANVFVADQFNHRIVKYDLEGTYVSQWSTGANSYPTAMVISGGNLYVTLNGNDSVICYSKVGAVVHAANTLPTNPLAICADNLGNIFVACENGNVYKCPSDISSDTEFFNSVQVVLGASCDAENNMYFTLQNANTVVKVSPAGTLQATYGSPGVSPGQFLTPRGIFVSGASLFVAESRRVQKLDLNGNSQMIFANISDDDGNFAYPQSLALDNNGHIYVTDRNNYRVQKFTTTGAFVAKWGTSDATDGNFKGPYGVTVDSFGNVYVSDSNLNRIQKFDSNGNFLSKWGSDGVADGQMNEASEISVDSSGNILVADASNHRISVFDNSGAFIRKFGSQGVADGQFDEPYGIAVAPNGDIFVSSMNSHNIQRFSSDGTFEFKFGVNGTADGQLEYPYGLGTDRAGNIYVADRDNHRIQKFKADGTFVCKLGSQGSGNGQFSYPTAIAIDKNGYLYVMDASNKRVQVFQPQ